MYKIDVEEVKGKVPVERVIDIFSLTMKEGRDKHGRAQWRGSCPTCKSSDKHNLVVTRAIG